MAKVENMNENHETETNATPAAADPVSHEKENVDTARHTPLEGEVEPDYVDGEASENSPEVTEAMLVANTIERETADTNKQRDNIHNILDKVFDDAVKEDDEKVVDGLPNRIRRMLDMRMPREAVERIQSQSMFFDENGNIQVFTEHLQRVDSIVIDYLASKIFGPRLNVKILSHEIVREGPVVSRAGNKEVTNYVCAGFAKVRITIRLDGGEKWRIEDVGLAEWAAPIESGIEEHRRARRIAYLGCVTLARKKALSAFGNVFQCVRDNEGLIDRIKESQKIKQAAKAAEGANLKSLQASVERSDAGSKKGTISIDPALKSSEDGNAKSLGKLAGKGTKGAKAKGDAKKAAETVAPGKEGEAKATADAASAEVEKPSADRVEYAKVNAPVANTAPAASVPDAHPFPLYRADGTHRGNLATAAIYATELAKMVVKAKAENDIDALIAHNKVGIDNLLADAKFRNFADQVRVATDARRKMLSDAEARKAASAAKKAEKEEARQRKAAVAQTDASANAAAAKATASASSTTPVEIEDPAGFGPVPGAVPAAPTTSTATEPASDVVEQPQSTGYAPTLIALRRNEDGSPVNQQPFGQAALDAISGAPTIADLENIAARLAEDLESAPASLSSFLKKTIEKQRNKLKAA